MENFNDYIKSAMEILPKGAFLTTKSEGKVNTMTIGWGYFGFAWGMPTAAVMVRESRFTKMAMDKEMEFTLTFPLDDSLKKELGYCGTKSGRDTDKIADCGFELLEGKTVSTPVINCKSLVFECKTLAVTKQDNILSAPEITEKWYKNGDLHTFYFAKVVNCYRI